MAGNSRGLPRASDAWSLLESEAHQQTGFFSNRVELLMCRQRVSEWLLWPGLGVGQWLEQKEAGAGDDCAFTGCPEVAELVERGCWEGSGGLGMFREALGCML